MRFGLLEKTGHKMLFLTCLMTLIFSNYGWAQNEGDTLWTRTYGDTSGQTSHSVVQTSDGGYAVAGLTGGFNTPDFWLIKTDSNGDTVWTNTYGTTDKEEAYSVKQTSDGGYVMVGWVSEDTSGYSIYNLYVVRTDVNGDTIWTWRYEGHDYAYIYDVEETPDSGFVLVGKTGQYLMDYNAYLIRLDPNGDTLWTRVYGGPDHQEGYDVELTLDGGYVITGHTGSCPDYDVYLIKIDANGDSLWGHTYGDTLIDSGWSVKTTVDGGYIIAGCTEYTTPGTLDAYFIKTNSIGDTIWTRMYGGPYTDEARSIYETISGNYIATGYYGPSDRDTDIYLLKLDINGDTLWTRQYGGMSWDYGYSVIQAADGSFLIAGGTNSFGAGQYDAYLLKIAGPELFGSIAGYVQDDIERAPIENVHVSAGQIETWTNEYGFYELRDLMAQSYDVSFSHPDYQDTTVTGVAVTPGNTTPLDVQMTATGGCDYVVGDVNGSDSYNGLDVTYGVAFFKGGAAPVYECECTPGNIWYVSGDVNASCSYNGLDITYGVAYFKGGPDPLPCPDCPPPELTRMQTVKYGLESVNKNRSIKSKERKSIK